MLGPLFDGGGPNILRLLDRIFTASTARCGAARGRLPWIVRIKSCAAGSGSAICGHLLGRLGNGYRLVRMLLADFVNLARIESDSHHGDRITGTNHSVEGFLKIVAFF